MMVGTPSCVLGLWDIYGD